MISGVDVWRSGGVTFAAFAASRLGIWSDPIPGTADAVPHSPAEALAASGADVILDGPMFANCNGGDYASSQCAVVRFQQIDLSSGMSFGTESQSEGITIAVVNGTAVAADGAQVPPGASVAIQCYPTLVRAGRNVADNNAGTNATAEMRAGVGILSDGRIVFAAGAVSMSGLASALIAAGAVEAGYTDGGGSTAMWLSDGQRYGASEHRRVATWIIARPETVLGSLMPSTASGRFVAAALVVAIVTGGYAWYTSRRR